jgi:hypothetical protein
MEKPASNSLPPVRGLDEEFIDPGPFPAIFQAVIEADRQVSHGTVPVPG